METYELPTVVDREEHIYDSGSTNEVTQEAQEVRNVVSVNTRPREHRKKMLILFVVLCMVQVVVIGVVSWLVYISMEQSGVSNNFTSSIEFRKMVQDESKREVDDLNKRTKKEIDDLNTVIEDFKKQTNKKIKVLENQIPALYLVQKGDCFDIKLRNPIATDGIYHIQPGTGTDVFPVFCDMSTDEGGWMVFQRRLDGSVDFYRDWNAYKTGFGNLNGEFWLGNEKLHALTSSGKYKLKIVLGDWDGTSRYAEYSSFSIGSEDYNYRLNVNGYSGNAGDGLKYHNGMSFSTKDNDNDESSSSCAVEIIGAWWYNSCALSSLNGEKLREKHNKPNYRSGVFWELWKGQQYSLKRSKMMFRRHV